MSGCGLCRVVRPTTHLLFFEGSVELVGFVFFSFLAPLSPPALWLLGLEPKSVSLCWPARRSCPELGSDPKNPTHIGACTDSLQRRGQMRLPSPARRGGRGESHLAASLK